MSQRRKCKKKKAPIQQLPVINPHVAGIDLGATIHYVCGPATEGDTANIRDFGTTTPELLKIADWLKGQQVTSVAMESTGVYWIPLFEVLDQAGFDVHLVNARQLHNVPGRKTDCQDCQWIQLLHSCGLLRKSFRPADEICRIRELTRAASELVQLRSQAVLHMQKALDQMNVLVHRALSDITGTTGQAIIRAIVGGERDPEVLAKLRDPRCKKSVDQIAEYLTGNWRDEHLFNLRQALARFDMFDRQIEDYASELRSKLESMVPEDRDDEAPPPHPKPNKLKAIVRAGDDALRDVLYRFSGIDLTVIDGISVKAGQTILSEVGPDISAFPDENHFVSWLRLCPNKPITGGRVKNGKSRNGHGSNRIATALRMGALTLNRADCALGAEFRRIARRHDRRVAIMAVARHMAKLVYRMLRYGQAYVDIGAEAYESQRAQMQKDRIQRQATRLGYELVPIPTEP